MYWKDLGSYHNISILLKPSSDLELLINHFNSAKFPENNNDPDIFSSKYYAIGKMYSINSGQ